MTVVHQPVHSPLRDAHDRGNLKDGQEPWYLAGEGEVPVIMPPRESQVPRRRADLPNAVARQMVLQVAVQDIGQLTDIQDPPGKGSRAGTQMSVSSTGTDLANPRRKTATAI